MSSKKNDRWLGAKLQIMAAVIFLWGLYGVSFGEIWIGSQTRSANAITGTMRSQHSFQTFTGGKARGMGLAMMLGATGLTLLNVSLKRESHSLAVSGLGLMAIGVVVFLAALIFLRY